MGCVWGGGGMRAPKAYFFNCIAQSAASLHQPTHRLLRCFLSQSRVTDFSDGTTITRHSVFVLDKSFR